MANKQKTIERDRNSDNGQFVTEEYRKRNPKTTEHEVIKILPRRKK